MGLHTDRRLNREVSVCSGPTARTCSTCSHPPARTLQRARRCAAGRSLGIHHVASPSSMLPAEGQRRHLRLAPAGCSVPERSKPHIATNIFAFQGSEARAAALSHPASAALTCPQDEPIDDDGAAEDEPGFARRVPSPLPVAFISATVRSVDNFPHPPFVLLCWLSFASVSFLVAPRCRPWPALRSTAAP